MRPLCLGGFLALVWSILSLGVALAEPAVEFKLGFKLLADRLPATVGQPLENEHYGPNGDSLQQTTKGLMVWRKVDNWTAFTNGSRTWINGPRGLQDRSNAERFDWEADSRLATAFRAEAAPQPTVDQDSSQTALSVLPPGIDPATEDAALGLIDASRAAAGIGPLVMDEAIRAVARAHSQDMGARDFFAHANLNGQSPFDRMRAGGVRFGWAAENLGWGKGYRTNLDSVRANHDHMMAEKPPEDGHRVNILNPRYKRVGIGVFKTPDGRVYYTCDFAD